jgi:CRP-like cAMP-binding protein
MYDDDGNSLEVATIGSDGLVGLPAVLSDGIGFGETVVQIPGDALRIAADDFKAEFASSPELRSILMRYVQAFMSQMAQSCACNGLHTAVQRSARWILMTQDRLKAAELELSQASLARMLGVGRPTITIATGALRDSGLVRFARGHLTVMDRRGLEAASCSCYAALAAESERLLDVRD